MLRSMSSGRGLDTSANQLGYTPAFDSRGSGVGAGWAETSSRDGLACCVGSITVIASVLVYSTFDLYLAGSSSSLAENSVPGTHMYRVEAMLVLRTLRC